MSYQEQIGPAALAKVFENIGAHAHMKAVFAVFAVSADWLFGRHQEAILIIFGLIFLDTATGLIKSWKQKTVSSRGFFRFAAKLLVYFILLATASLVDKVMPMGIALPIMSTFLSVTEGISVIENIGAMGYSVPTHLLQKWRNIRGGDGKKEN